MPRERKTKSSSKSTGSASSAKKDVVKKEHPGLRTIVQQKLLKDVFEATEEMHKGWMVLVVDKSAMRVISSAVGMYDVMEKHITIVEDICKKRAPFKDMGVIYFLACTEDSVNRLIADFENPLYGKEVFVYFLGRMSEKQFGKIKECKPLVRRLKALCEINMDFLVQENRAFHFDMRSSFAPLYVRNKKSKVENKIADKLVTLCATLNEMPHVRFPADSACASTLAKTFHLKMETFVRHNESFWYHGDPNNTNSDRATLLVLDRKDDCITPLMHDFTYQAMINDLLPIEEDRISYVPESSGPSAAYDDDDDDEDDDDEDGDDDDDEEDPKPKLKKKEGAVDVLLNESDNVWVELRGKHIAVVIGELSERIREMVASDTHSGFNSKDKGKTMSLSAMASALKALPEYKEVMSKLSQHMHISHECMDHFNNLNLLDLSGVEQSLATGKTEDGANAKYAELLSEAEGLLAQAKTSGDRFRLLMILIISQGGIRPSDRERLMSSARLTADQQHAIENFASYLDVVINKETESTTKNVFSSVFGQKEGAPPTYDPNSEYSNSRYLPPMKHILTQCCKGSLSFQQFPSVVPMPQESGGSSGTAYSARKKVEGSARRGGATDRWQRSNNKEKLASADQFTGGRLIVFMVGGMAFSELRVTREVMEAEKREIVAGSTAFIKPLEFVDDVVKMA